MQMMKNHKLTITRATFYTNRMAKVFEKYGEIVTNLAKPANVVMSLMHNYEIW